MAGTSYRQRSAHLSLLELGGQAAIEGTWPVVVPWGRVSRRLCVACRRRGRPLRYRALLLRESAKSRGHQTKYPPEGVEKQKAGRLDGLELTYIWVDGLDGKAGLEKDKAAVLVAIVAVHPPRNSMTARKPCAMERPASCAMRT